ncbi:hypothetical protein AB1Y20_011055 [Prymnesium parvum]|uniref:Protein-L-isoaspartate O-methyltransferase n=1 Tax=Prymnesium parvum TaxID=97485 RepID=A0AB34ILT1_PRYPA|mmetsp:Transcript_9044/g.21767  ORF Transcript_9044/g.21767 Transcript_9044/m.21767 type:complete len:339 (-) Transcript_9044:387-1403(-)
MAARLAFQGEVTTNDRMVDYLAARQILATEKVIHAFRAVDRAFFIKSSANVYLDMPIREGVCHLSAPGIYGLAFEAFQFAEGHSFLNIGSGTGYLSAVAAQLIGERAIHYAVERQRKLVEHARAKLAAAGVGSVQLVHSDCFAIEPSMSMRFDRIYVGAGASDDARFLMGMLEVGGVLVGPFENEMGQQKLIRCERLSEEEFVQHDLMSVHFQPLVYKHRTSPVVPVSLCAPRWSPRWHQSFPPEHRAVVMTVLALHAREECILSLLPKEILIEFVFPQIEYNSFSRSRSSSAQSSEGIPELNDKMRTSSEDDEVHVRATRFLRRAVRVARALFGHST